jgi:hypothetical protein
MFGGVISGIGHAGLVNEALSKAGSIAYDPTEDRRLFSPPQGSDFLAGLAIPRELKAQAVSVIKEEYDQMDAWAPLIEDSRFVVEIEQGIQDPGELVGSLYLRGLFQLQLLEAFVHLAGRGVLSFDALYEAIDYPLVHSGFGPTRPHHSKSI